MLTLHAAAISLSYAYYNDATCLKCSIDDSSLIYFQMNFNFYMCPG